MGGYANLLEICCTSWLELKKKLTIQEEVAALSLAINTAVACFIVDVHSLFDLKKRISSHICKSDGTLCFLLLL